MEVFFFLPIWPCIIRRKAKQLHEKLPTPLIYSLFQILSVQGFLQIISNKTNLKVFVSKLVAINGFTAGAVKICEITALAHKLGDYTVKYRSLFHKGVNHFILDCKILDNKANYNELSAIFQSKL